MQSAICLLRLVWLTHRFQTHLQAQVQNAELIHSNVFEVQSMLMCVQIAMALVVTGAAQMKVTYPQLGAMVSYTQSRQAALKQAAATARGSLDMSKPLPLQPKAYLALITFLRECRKQHTDDRTSVSQDYLGDDLSCLVCK